MAVIIILLALLLFYVGFHEDSKFGKSNENVNDSRDYEKYKELVRFISFSRKIKQLTGGNYGIYISYDTPDKGHIGHCYATFGFYDFNEIKFAREQAISSPSAPINMVGYYYKKICEQAGLNRQDWPYAIDEYDFADVMRGTFCESFFTLIPDEYNDDIFTFKVTGGIDSCNAIQVSNLVINLIKSKFPELQITRNHATSASMGIHIQI